MPRPIITASKNILLFSSLVFCQMVHSQSKTVEITDRRPIAAAIAQLEAIYGWPINYEDPITVNKSRMEDVSTLIQSTNDSSHPVMAHKRGTLSFTYREVKSLPSWGGSPDQFKAETETAIADALASILAGYTASGAPETFSIREEDGTFSVVSTAFLNKEGKIEIMTPILDTRITILPKPRTRLNLLDEICQTLNSTTGIRVDCVIPFALRAMEEPTNISGANVTARSLLHKLLAELTTPEKDYTFVYGPKGEKLRKQIVIADQLSRSASWQLLYAVGDGYGQSAHLVAAVDK